MAPHVNASTLANGDAYVAVVKSSDVRDSSHLIRNLSGQLYKIIRLSDFYLSAKGKNMITYWNRTADIRLVANAQLPITVTAPHIQPTLVRERERVRVSTDYLD
jgi:hypothetical protein